MSLAHGSGVSKFVPSQSEKAALLFLNSDYFSRAVGVYEVTKKKKIR